MHLKETSNIYRKKQALKMKSMFRLHQKVVILIFGLFLIMMEQKDNFGLIAKKIHAFLSNSKNMKSSHHTTQSDQAMINIIQEVLY